VRERLPSMVWAVLTARVCPWRRSMLERIMAEHRVRPESLERKHEYMEKLRAFRARVARSAEVVCGDAKPLSRPGLEAEMHELHALLKAYDNAAIKDSFSFNLPLVKLPKLRDSIDEEVRLAGERISASDGEAEAKGS
jgi:hypothetical protein